MAPKRGKSKKKASKNRGVDQQADQSVGSGAILGTPQVSAGRTNSLEFVYDLEAGINLNGVYSETTFATKFPSTMAPEKGSTSSLSACGSTGVNALVIPINSSTLQQQQNLDPCHNRQPYRESSLCRSCAEREWNWDKLAPKAFNSFLSTSEIGIDADNKLEMSIEEVLKLIEGLRCQFCKDKVRLALERCTRGYGAPGLYLTKHVKFLPHPAASQAFSAPAPAMASSMAYVHDAEQSCGNGWTQSVLKLSNGLGVEHIQQLQEQIVAMCEPLANSGQDAVDVLHSGSASDSDLDGNRVSEELLASGGVASAVGVGAYSLMSDFPPKDQMTYLTNYGDLSLYQSDREGYQSGISSEDEDDSENMMQRPWQSELASLFESVQEKASHAQDLGNALTATMQTNSNDGTLVSSSDGGYTSSASVIGADAWEWNPKLTHLLSNADTTLGQWMRQITSLLLYLSRLDLLAFLSSKEDQTIMRALVEELWSSYESALERLLAEATANRREQLKDNNGSQATVVPFCFASRSRQQLARLIQKKRVILEELHDCLIHRCSEPSSHSLFRRLSRVKQTYEKRLFTADWHELDAREDGALNHRLLFFSENSFIATRNDLMAQEQQIDCTLKKAIADWDAMLEQVRVETVQRARRDLDPVVYPQTPKLQQYLDDWYRKFDQDWEELQQAQQLKAKLSQQEVTRLQSQLHNTRQQLKSAKEQAAVSARKKRKEELAKGITSDETHSLISKTTLQNFGLMLLDQTDDDLLDEGDERTSVLATLCLMTNQRQLEHCLQFRLFAARNAFQRHRLVREFFAQYRWRVMNKDRQVQNLCGADEDAMNRLRVLLTCHLLYRLDRDCGRHTAERYQRQLVEAADREDLAAQRHAQRRSKFKDQRTHKQKGTLPNSTQDTLAGEQSSSSTENSYVDERGESSFTPSSPQVLLDLEDDKGSTTVPASLPIDSPIPELTISGSLLNETLPNSESLGCLLDNIPELHEEQVEAEQRTSVDEKEEETTAEEDEGWSVVIRAKQKLPVKSRNLLKDAVKLEGKAKSSLAEAHSVGVDSTRSGGRTSNLLPKGIASLTAGVLVVESSLSSAEKAPEEPTLQLPNSDNDGSIMSRAKRVSSFDGCVSSAPINLTEVRSRSRPKSNFRGGSPRDTSSLTPQGLSQPSEFSESVKGGIVLGNSTSARGSKKVHTRERPPPTRGVQGKKYAKDKVTKQAAQQDLISTEYHDRDDTGGLEFFDAQESFEEKPSDNETEKIAENGCVFGDEDSWTTADLAPLQETSIADDTAQKGEGIEFDDDGLLSLSAIPDPPATLEENLISLSGDLRETLPGDICNSLEEEDTLDQSYCEDEYLKDKQQTKTELFSQEVEVSTYGCNETSFAHSEQLKQQEPLMPEEDASILGENFISKVQTSGSTPSVVHGEQFFQEQGVMDATLEEAQPMYAEVDSHFPVTELVDGGDEDVVPHIEEGGTQPCPDSNPEGDNYVIQFGGFGLDSDVDESGEVESAEEDEFDEAQNEEDDGSKPIPIEDQFTFGECLQTSDDSDASQIIPEEISSVVALATSDPVEGDSAEPDHYKKDIVPILHTAVPTLNQAQPQTRSSVPSSLAEPFVPRAVVASPVFEPSHANTLPASPLVPPPVVMIPQNPVPIHLMGQIFSQMPNPATPYFQHPFNPTAGMIPPNSFTQIPPGRPLHHQVFANPAINAHLFNQRQTAMAHHPVSPQPHLYPQPQTPMQFRPSAPEWVPQVQVFPSGQPSPYPAPQPTFIQSHPQVNQHQHMLHMHSQYYPFLPNPIPLQTGPPPQQALYQQPQRTRYPTHEYEYNYSEPPLEKPQSVRRRGSSSYLSQQASSPTGGGSNQSQAPRQQTPPEKKVALPITSVATPQNAVTPEKIVLQEELSQEHFQPSLEEDDEQTDDVKDKEEMVAQENLNSQESIVPQLDTIDQELPLEVECVSNEEELAEIEPESVPMIIEQENVLFDDLNLDLESSSNSNTPARVLPRGLANASGQNNCFLNVVVQSLWHLDAFREQFCQAENFLSGVIESEEKENEPDSQEAHSECIRKALASVFQGLSQQPTLGVEEVASAVSVDQLREALNQRNRAGSHFGVGRMDDAVEALEVLLSSLPSDLQGIVKGTFCMNLQEVMKCPKCGGLSPQPPNAEYGTNTFYVPVNSLQSEHLKNPAANFSSLLKFAGRGDLHTCLNSACTVFRRGDYVPSERRLIGEPPRVFSLGLVWESLQTSSEAIAQVFSLFESTIDLNTVLSSDLAEEQASEDAQIRGFFCFQPYKHHYIAFFFNSDLGEWFLYDDATIQQVGPDYRNVINICTEGLLQPLVVFYEVIKYHKNLKPMQCLRTDHRQGKTPIAKVEGKQPVSKISRPQNDGGSLNSLVASNSSSKKRSKTPRKKSSGK